MKRFNRMEGAPIVLIRLLVGAVFLSEGIQKFLFPASLGVGRFVKIGIRQSKLLQLQQGLIGNLVAQGIESCQRVTERAIVVDQRLDAALKR